MKTFWLLTLLVFAGTGVEALSEAQESAQRHYQQGLAYERLGRLQEAYSELQLASALDSNSASMFLALGVVAMRLDKTGEALRALERSIVLDANSAASYYHLALIYEKKNQRERALESWHRFLPLTADEELKNVAQRHIQHLEVP